jgi:hypothetical protein
MGSAEISKILTGQDLLTSRIGNAQLNIMFSFETVAKAGLRLDKAPSGRAYTPKLRVEGRVR